MGELVFFFNHAVMGGLVISSIYAMGAIGVTLVFGILRFAHFAHAEMMTAGALFALVLAIAAPGVDAATGLPAAFVLLPVAMAMTALLAIGLDRAFYRPLREVQVRPVVMVMASIGVTLMLQGLIRLLVGTQAQPLYVASRKDIFRIPVPFEGARGLVITEPQIMLFGFVAVAVVALHLFLTRSRIGKAMRAMSDNPDLARVTGINADHVVWATWVIAGSLAAAAGTLLSLDVTLKPDLSFNLLLPIFAAAIVGGVGKPYGAVAGGFIVGFAESLAVFNWAVLLRPMGRSLPPDLIAMPTQLSFVGTEYKIVVPFFILVAVLVWRPTGLFRGRIL
jgi:branched-chain amino acid transport system permease protein